MKSKTCESALKECVGTFNTTDVMVDKVKIRSDALFIHLYATTAENLTQFILLHSVPDNFQKKLLQSGILSPYFS